MANQQSATSMKPTKPKKCKECKQEFVPTRPLQSVCSPGCAIERVTKQRKTKERKEYREAKEKQKRKGDWLGETQKVFNAYIRARDRKAGFGCISCGTKANVQYAAGHYRTVGSSPELRFDERNVHLQCNRRCNLELSGNILQYRAGLIQRYGLEIVKYLEGPHEPKHYSIEDLKQLKAEYQAKMKGLK